MFKEICKIIIIKDRYLAEIIEDIERMLYIDSYTVILKGRTIGERIVKAIIEEEGILNTEELSQKDKINLLADGYLLSEYIAKALHVVRICGNRAIHDAVKGSFETSLVVSRNLYKILSWYISVYIDGDYEIREYKEPDVIAKIGEMENQVRNVMNVLVERSLIGF